MSFIFRPISRPYALALSASLLMSLMVGCGAAEPGLADTAVKDVRAPAAEPAAPGDGAGAEAGAPTAPPERPSLRIATLDHGEFSLDAKRGRWVVVNFWATWCAPCLKEMPELDAFDRRREDVEVVGLAYEEIVEDGMRAFLKQRPVAYAIAIVDVFDPPVDFATPQGLPLTHLIAPDGRIAKTFLGPITGEDLDAAIAAHPRAAGGAEVAAVKSKAVEAKAVEAAAVAAPSVSESAQ